MSQRKDRLAHINGVNKDYLDQIGLPQDWTEHNRENRVFKKAISFNRQCEYLGVSDINPSHVQRIASLLGEGELVAMLPQPAHSMWQSGLMDKIMHRTVFNPGRSYIASQCRLLISPRSIHVPGLELGFSEHPLLGELPTIPVSDIYSMLQPSAGNK